MFGVVGRAKKTRLSPVDVNYLWSFLNSFMETSIQQSFKFWLSCRLSALGSLLDFQFLLVGCCTITGIGKTGSKTVSAYSSVN